MENESCHIIFLNGKATDIEELKSNCLSGKLSDWERKIYRFITDWFDTNDFIIQKTSGSTGAPKVIQLKKNAMAASARATLRYFKLQPGNTALLSLPVDYIAGKMMIVRAIVGKLNLLLTEPSGTPEIPACQIDLTAMVPLQMKRLIDKQTDLNNIHNVILGGAQVGYLLIQQIKELSVQVWESYGMTETCSHIALRKINGTNPDNCFKTLKGITVATDDKGCLTIHAPDLSPVPILTTDIVQIISPATFNWLGRADNIINSGGLKIYPEELETLLSPIIDKECIISSKQDTLLGNRVVLVIEGNIGEMSEEMLMKKIEGITGKHKTPREIICLDQFPRNESMKIDRLEVHNLINQL